MTQSETQIATRIAADAFPHPTEWQHRQVLATAIEIAFKEQEGQRWCNYCGSKDIVKGDPVTRRSNQQSEGIELLREWSEETDVSEIRDQKEHWEQIQPKIVTAGAEIVADDTATQMRTACVEKVKAAIHDLSRTSIAAEQNAGKIDVLIQLREELKAVTLDQVKQKEQR